MKLLIVAAVILVLYALYVRFVRTSKAPAKSGGATLPRKSSDARGIEVTLWKSEDIPNGQSVKLSNSVTLTFIGAGADKVTQFLAGTVHRERDPEKRVQLARARTLNLALLMSQENIECPEVDAWRVAVLKRIEKAARAAVAEGGLLAEPGRFTDEEIEEALQDARSDALADVGVPDYIELEELAAPRPDDPTVDDALIARLSQHVPDVGDLMFYIKHAGTLIESHADRSKASLSALTAAGFALPGHAAPPDAIVERYKVAELRAAIEESQKIRRKAEAVSLLTADVAVRLPGIDRMFYIKPLSAQDAAAMAAFRWIHTHAELIATTFRCAERAAIAVAESRGLPDVAFTISGECCRESKAWANRDLSRRRPTSLPPFHIGCTAELEVS